MPLSQLKDVLWLQTGFLGDIILTTAAIKALRQEAPDVRQHLITTPVGAQALSGSQLLDSIACFDKRQKSLLRGCRDLRQQLKPYLHKHSSVLIQPHRSLRSSLLASCLAVPRITYRETAGSLWARHRVPRVAVLHEAQRIALLLEPLGLERQKLFGVLPDLATQRSLGLATKWQAFFTGHKVIGVAPGSVWGTKRWPVERFSALVGRLLQALPDHRLVLLGAAQEQAACEQIMAAYQDQRLLNLAGQTSLQDMALLVPQLMGLIGNDSAPIHYASAAGVPTVAVFGATVSAMGFGPLAARSRVVEQSYLECRPCGDHGPAVCPLGHFKCMKDIDVEQVWQAVKQCILEPGCLGS